APQLGVARQLLVGASGLGRGGVLLRRRLLQLDLRAALVDDEEHVTLTDDLAVGEMDLGQIAAHLRADLDEIDRRELPGEGGRAGDAALQRRADGHRRRWRRGW